MRGRNSHYRSSAMRFFFQKSAMLFVTPANAFYYAILFSAFLDASAGTMTNHARRVAFVSSSAKAGLAWPNGNWDDMSQYLSAKVSWYYTWSPYAISDDAGIEFVPMLWGENQVEDFASTINRTVSQKKATAVLGFNEPQETSQSNLTIQQGVELWQTYIEPLRSQGMRLGTPATSSAPSGLTWVQDWLEACDGGCTVDFVALHWYDINATNFIEYVQHFHDVFQKPIWVTEWACQNFNNATDQCSSSQISEFMNITQSWMDATDWVERYSWFGAMRDMQGVNEEDALMYTSGDISALGHQYIGGSSLVSSSTWRSKARPAALHGIAFLFSSSIVLLL